MPCAFQTNYQQPVKEIGQPEVCQACPFDKYFVTPDCVPIPIMKFECVGPARKRSENDLQLLIIRQNAVAVLIREQSLMMGEHRGTECNLVILLSATEGNLVILIVI